MDHEYGNGTAIFTRDGDTVNFAAKLISAWLVLMFQFLFLLHTIHLGVGKNPCLEILTNPDAFVSILEQKLFF